MQSANTVAHLFYYCETLRSNTYHKSIEMSKSNLMKISCITFLVCWIYAVRSVQTGYVMLLNYDITQNLIRYIYFR